MKTCLVLFCALAATNASPYGFLPRGYYGGQGSTATGNAAGNVISGTSNGPLGGSQITQVSATANGSVRGSGYSSNSASASNAATSGIFGNQQFSNTNAVSNQRTFGGAGALGFGGHRPYSQYPRRGGYRRRGFY